MARTRIGKLTLLMGTALMLAGCQEGTQPFAFLKHRPTGAEAKAAPTQENSVKLVDRDVEAPEVYHAKATGLWDGRPSLGGVWVASPDVKDPERVIIRNPANGKFVIGALFKRERLNPGPKMQLSSDAASALGMLAGQPATIDVTALRRQATPVPPPDASAPRLDSQEQIQGASVSDIKTGASAAIDRATAGGKAAPASGVSHPAGKPVAGAAVASGISTAATPAATSMAVPVRTELPPAKGRSYLQIGIFSVEANAQRAAKELGRNGVSATITREETHGKSFWRVVVGPTPASDRTAMLAKAKKLGFDDAYFVSK